MERLVVWLNSLSPAENILVSVSVGLAGLMFLGSCVALFFRWMDKKGDETQVSYPTEDELRRRDDENAKRAYKTMTRGKP